MTRPPRYRARLLPAWLTEVIAALGLVAFLLVMLYFGLAL